MTDRLNYFAYGSNLLHARLAVRTPSVARVGVATLAAHRLTFTKPGGDGSGKCGIEPGNSGDFVIGVVYEMDAQEKPLLDEIEGVGHGYRDRPVTISWIGEDGDRPDLEVFTYYPTRFDCALQPFDWYKALVLEGARENRFPEDYIARIESIHYREDPDSGRRSANFSICGIQPREWVSPNKLE